MQCHVTMTASQAVCFVLIYTLKMYLLRTWNISFWLTLLDNLGLNKSGDLMPLITLVLSATNDSPWSLCQSWRTGGCLKHVFTGRSRSLHFKSASLLPDPNS